MTAKLSARTWVVIALAVGLVGGAILGITASADEMVDLTISDVMETLIGYLAAAFIIWAAISIGPREPVGRQWLLIGSGVLIFFIATKRKRPYTIALIVLMGVSMLFFHVRVLGAINPHMSPRAISGEINSNLGPGDGFAAYSGSGSYWWDGYLYYTKRYIDLFSKTDELRDYYGQDRRVIVIMRDHDFEALPDDIKAELKTVKPFKVAEKEMVLTSNEVLK